MRKPIWEGGQTRAEYMAALREWELDQLFTDYERTSVVDEPFIDPNELSSEELALSFGAEDTDAY